MEVISFDVQGSASKPYTVTFVKRSGNNFSAGCSCPAGEKGQYCKHRFSILDGKSIGIVSNNVDQVQIIKSWLPGSDLEEALKKMKALEAEALKIKKELAAAKKKVAVAMRD